MESIQRDAVGQTVILREFRLWRDNQRIRELREDSSSCGLRMTTGVDRSVATIVRDELSSSSLPCGRGLGEGSPSQPLPSREGQQRKFLCQR